MTTSKERMAAAMRLEKADRVPVMCQLALGHYFLQSDIPATEIWHSSEAFGDALIDLQRRYGFDGILINLPGREPNWQRHLRGIEDTSEGQVLRWSNGFYTVCPPDDNPHVYGKGGQSLTTEFDEIDPDDLFYVEPHGIFGAVTFEGSAADCSDGFPSWQFDTVDYVVQRVGDKVSIHGELFSPFTQLLELLGYTEGLMALMDDPEKCERCLEALALGTIELGRGQAEHGVDAILISSAFAGAGFISPDHYRRFVQPFERSVIDGIRESYDIPVYIHTCGSINDRLDLMADTGAAGLDTLDSPPLGNVDLGDAKQRVGGQMFLKGNLDGVNVLLNGTEELVLEASRICIEAAGPGGGYILSSACSVPPYTPPKNIMAMLEAAERFGAYS